eukprot:TRINITY_DN7856_c0_g1_i1.p1 TRINITY_DN7856_c0_g1~~TRINITY_DN7856_c0_g1_i1.p1  ORF type:complete len:988 (-),score=102.81 TRINITY_DN7856_c0_g1_i1:109-3072(-)
MAACLAGEEVLLGSLSLSPATPPEAVPPPESMEAGKNPRRPRFERFSVAVTGLQAVARMALQAVTIASFRQSRRETLRTSTHVTDVRFRAPEVQGVSSRDFEIDLLHGEEFCGDVIKVKLNKSMSRLQTTLRMIGTCGLYWLWTRFCISRAHVFEHDARLAITNRGRVLMWTLSASGGGKTILQRLGAVLITPSFLLLVVITISFFTIVPAMTALQYSIMDLGVFISVVWLSAFTALLFSIFLDNLSVVCCTSVRQFESRDVSFVRVFCYEQHQGCMRGSVQMTEAQLYFGAFPKPDVLKQALPAEIWDSCVTRTGVVISAEKQQGNGESELKEGRPSAMDRFIYGCGIAVVVCAFLALLNEIVSVLYKMVICSRENTGWVNIAECTHLTVIDWFTGSVERDPFTVFSHWISVMDWSLQVVCYLYYAGPALTLLASSLGDQSAATFRFIVDHRHGNYTEDADFQNNWESLNHFLSELLGRACPSPGIRAHATLGSPSADATWAEVPGDVSFPPEVDALPFSSWSQVQKMSSTLLDHSKNQVRVYTGALAFVLGENVLATYPTKQFTPLITRVIMVLTCGFEYWWNWYGVRRESAVILTDRRLLEVSVKSSKRQRSMKVDMFVIDSSIKYISLCPPQPRCCQRGNGLVTMSTRCGNVDITLRNLTYFQKHGARLWHGIAVLQNLKPMAAVTSDTDAGVVDCDTDSISFGRTSVGGGLSIGRPSLFVRSVDGATKRAFAFGAQELDGSEGIAACAPRKVPMLPGSSESQVLAAPLLSCVGSRSVEAERVRLLCCHFGNDPWGVALVEGEEVLWGPVTFDEDLTFRWYRRDGILRRPSSVAAITSHRLVVQRYGNFGCLGCSGRFNRSFVQSITSIPLQGVFGFCIQESYSSQTNLIARKLGSYFRKKMMSKVEVKTLSNAGSGKAYLRSLQVEKRAIILDTKLKLCFEDEPIKELRRWLGQISLHFDETKSELRDAIDLVACARGWTPR